MLMESETMNYWTFLRLQKGLTQRELAKLLIINPVTACRIERGWYAKPPEGLEERLQAIFGSEWSFARLMESVPDLGAVRPDAP